MYRFIFYEGQTFADKIIRYRTFLRLLFSRKYTYKQVKRFSKYTHVAMYNTVKKTIVESVKGEGVRELRSVSSCYRGCFADMYIINMSNEICNIVWNDCLIEKGKGYDTKGAIGLGLKKHSMENKDKFFCTELILAKFWHYNIRFLDFGDPVMVFPGELPISQFLKLEVRMKV